MSKCDHAFRANCPHCFNAWLLELDRRYRIRQERRRRDLKHSLMYAMPDGIDRVNQDIFENCFRKSYDREH